MKMHCIANTTAGRRHVSMGKANEDFVKVYESDRIVILAAADGCSGSFCARPAAEATVAACIELALDPNIWEMKPKAIRAACTHILDKHYLACPYPYEQLAATMALVIINRMSEQYIAISIGDCSCIMLTDTLEPTLLLEPVNLFRQRNQTVFANSSAASRYMQMKFGTMDGVAGFMLLTDGADRLLDHDRVSDIQQLTSLTVLSLEQAQTVLQEYVEGLSDHTSDDITVAIAMRCDDEQLTKLAGATYHAKLIPDDEQNDDPIQSDCPTEDEPAAVELDEEASLLGFLRQPRSAEELVVAGYVTETSILTVLYPYLKDGSIGYRDHKFCCI